VFVRSEVVLWWLVMEHEDALAGFALEIGVNKPSPLSLGLGKFQR
jgi:hypothetical protein